MNDRREPTISPLPLDKEEAPRARAQAAGQAASSRPSPPRSGPPPVSSRPVVVRSPLGPLALIVALAAAGFAGYVFWQLQQAQQNLSTATTALSAADERIAALEKRLMLSDDESTQSLTALQANVKENASEIRKLWGVAYDRNRTAIAKLEESVTKIEKSVAGIDGKIKAALNDVVGEVKVLAELMDAQQAVIARADQGIKEQAAAISATLQKLDDLDALRKKVQSNEEAIKAIDAFRLQVNRELIKLRGE